MLCMIRSKKVGKYDRMEDVLLFEMDLSENGRFEERARSFRDTRHPLD